MVMGETCSASKLERVFNSLEVSGSACVSMKKDDKSVWELPPLFGMMILDGQTVGGPERCANTGLGVGQAAACASRPPAPKRHHFDPFAVVKELADHKSRFPNFAHLTELARTETHTHTTCSTQHARHKTHNMQVEETRDSDVSKTRRVPTRRSTAP